MAGDEDYEIPDSGAVFTFGRSRFAENLSSHFFIRNDPVMEISCGDEHTALVCKSGRVFLFGQNDFGQLGFGHTKTLSKPSCLKFLKPFHSTHVACGKGHTIVSTACGRLFTFGCNSDGQLGTGDLNDRIVPQLIPTGLSDEEFISAVSAGCQHSAFLTDKGDVYLWGSNSDGQCGADSDTYLPVPHKIEFDYPVSSVSCGYYHTAFTSEGNTYTFGEEENGKLGRSRKLSKSVPEKIEIPGKCISVKCGGNHTLALTENGEVYAFGSNFSGQLGIGNSEPECSIPTKVKFLDENRKVVYIACGESHSAFLTENGVLYTCGDARYGKLCNEDESTNCTSPTVVDLFENYTCTSVSCGGCHTMVLAKIRFPQNDINLICSPTNKAILPPLKIKKDFEELKNGENDARISNGEKTKKVDSKNDEDNEECDSKSNTESNLNNEEETSHVDEIQPEIQDVDKEDVKSILNDSDSKSIAQEKLNDTVVVTPETTVKKLLNVFKKKKTVSAVVISEKFEGKAENTPQAYENIKIGNQQKSRTCVIL